MLLSIFNSFDTSVNKRQSLNIHALLPFYKNQQYHRLKSLYSDTPHNYVLKFYIIQVIVQTNCIWAFGHTLFKIHLVYVVLQTFNIYVRRCKALSLFFLVIQFIIYIVIFIIHCNILFLNNLLLCLYRYNFIIGLSSFTKAKLQKYISTTYK